MVPQRFRALLGALPQRPRTLGLGLVVGGETAGIALARPGDTPPWAEVVCLHWPDPNTSAALFQRLEAGLRLRGFDAIRLRFDTENDHLLPLLAGIGFEKPVLGHTLIARTLEPLAFEAARWMRARPTKRLRLRPGLPPDFDPGSGLCSEIPTGVRPLSDSDPQASVTAELDGKTVGWLGVSRRRRGLLYNSWYVPRTVRGTPVAAAMLVHALRRHLCEEPTAPALAHVMDHHPRMMTLCRKYLLPYVEEVESWYITAKACLSATATR